MKIIGGLGKKAASYHIALQCVDGMLLRIIPTMI